MLKKMWAIVLSVAMLVSLCPSVSVFAASKNDNLITENFEDETIDAAITELNTTATVTKEITNGVLKITDLNNAAGIGFNVPTYTNTGNDVFLSYDIQFSKIPTNVADDKAIFLGGSKSDGGLATLKARQLTVDGNTDFYISYQNTSGVWQNGVPVVEGKWYSIHYVRDNNVIFGALTDKNGEILCVTRRAGQSAVQTVYSLVKGSANALGNGEILIDNVKFNWFSDSTYGPAVSQYYIDRVSNGSVSPTAKSALIVFDQAIATNPTVTLTSEDSTTISCTVKKENNTSFASTFMYRVSWKTDLKSGTNYTLVLSGKNAQNVAIDSTGTISFATETVAAPAITNSTIQDGATNVLKNIGSVTVTFDSELATTGATLTPAGGSAVACPMTAGSAANTYVVTLPTLKGDTAYTLGFAASKNAAGVPVSDAISFTTEAASIEETVLTDDFEDNSVFTTEANGYTTQYTGAFIQSDLNGAYKVTGYPNTGNAVKFMYTNDTYTRTRIYTNSPYVFGNDETYVFTYRVKISNPTPVYNEAEKRYEDVLSALFGGVHTSPYGLPQQSDTGAALTVDADGKHYIFGNGRTEKWFYDENTWYNAVYSVNKNGVSYRFLDVNTGEELFEYSETKDYSNANGYYITLANLTSKSADLKRNTSEDAYIVIDDVSMWNVDTSKATHALAASSAVNANVVTLTFNQPTTITADMLAVSTDSAGNEKVDADIDVKYTDFDTNVVTISGLNYGESYYLDYSAVKSAGGAAIASGAQATSLIQFTMPEPTVSVMDKAKYANRSVTLDYWNMDGKANAAFIAAFYKGTTLVDVAVLAEQALSAKKNPVTITPANVPEDADGMIVYALNSLGNLVPLCVPTTKVAIN